MDSLFLPILFSCSNLTLVATGQYHLAVAGGSVAVSLNCAAYHTVKQPPGTHPLPRGGTDPIDKQSHPNHSNGQIWDTIEFDKAVGVGRSFLNANDRKDSTLLLVTADHDQSMVITGLIDTSVPGAIQNARSNSPYPATAPPPPAGAGGVNPGESDGFPDYEDANGDRYPENLNRFKIGVGYRTGNHTGSSVPITAEGTGALLFLGYFDQTDVFFKMAKALSTNTKQLDQALDQKQKEDVPTFNPPASLRSGPHSKTILEKP